MNSERTNFSEKWNVYTSGGRRMGYIWATTRIEAEDYVKEFLEIEDFRVRKGQ